MFTMVAAFDYSPEGTYNEHFDFRVVSLMRLMFRVINVNDVCTLLRNGMGIYTAEGAHYFLHINNI